MMIRLHTPSGNAEFVHHEHIARVTEAGASSQWHGIKCFVRLRDGKVIEAQETAQWVVNEIDRAHGIKEQEHE